MIQSFQLNKKVNKEQKRSRNKNIQKEEASLSSTLITDKYDLKTFQKGRMRFNSF